MKVELDHREVTTIRMALCAWSARCASEAEIMDKWAEDENLNPEKCRRNAVASREMKAEAIDLLAKLP